MHATIRCTRSRYSTGYSKVRFVTQCIQPCMAMYDSVHAAMHGDSALSAIDSEILHGSRLAGATLTSQLQQGSLRNPKLPLRSTSTTRGQPNFRSRTAGGHGHLHYNIPSTPYNMVYSIPTDPELDLAGLWEVSRRFQLSHSWMVMLQVRHGIRN